MELFEQSMLQPDDDGMRTCGNCMERKSVDEFYKDGKGSDGKPRYRRDCKDCYRVSRLSSRQTKRSQVMQARTKTSRRRRKK